MKAMGFVGEALEFEHVCLIKNQESRKGCNKQIRKEELVTVFNM